MAVGAAFFSSAQHPFHSRAGSRSQRLFLLMCLRSPRSISMRSRSMTPSWLGRGEHNVKTSLFVALILVLSTVPVGQNLGACRNGMAINREFDGKMEND